MADDAQVRSKLFQIAGFSAALVAVLVALAFILPWLFGLMQPAPKPLPVAVPKVEPLPAPAPRISQIERIRAALAPEIQAGSITVDAAAGWIAIRVGNLITFDSGRADVLPGFLPVGRRIAEIAEREKGPLRIVGHTDDQALGGGGPFKDNQGLSVARAEAVAKQLRPALTEPARIAVEGRGSAEAISSNATPDGRAKNRRVEVLITRAD